MSTTTSGAVSALVVVVGIRAVADSLAASPDRAPTERTRARAGDRLPRRHVEDLRQFLLDRVTTLSSPSRDRGDRLVGNVAHVQCRHPADARSSAGTPTSAGNVGCSSSRNGSAQSARPDRVLHVMHMLASFLHALLRS